MGIYVASQVIKLMIKKGQIIEKAKVLVLGLTFKENCPDIRNSRVIDVIRELQEYECDVSVSDYWADKEEVQKEYGIDLIDEPNLEEYDAIVLAVAHDNYKVLNMTKSEKQVLFDIKSVVDNNKSDGRL